MPNVMTTGCSSALRLLGDSDLAISRIGFGTWGLGGGNWEYSLGPQDDKESVRAIHCALDFGVNWVDTSPLYGFGHSEEIVARAVRSTHKKPYIFTKCGSRWRADGVVFSSLKANSVAEEVESSLRRFGVDSIDLCQIHWPEPETEIEEGCEALIRLREQGKVRWIGVSNFSVEQMKRAQRIAPVTSLQPPYSILRREIEGGILPFSRTNNIGVINYSAMGCGLLTGNMSSDVVDCLPKEDFRRTLRDFQEPRLSRILQMVKLLRNIGREHAVSPAVVSVAWALHHPDVTATIVGLRSANEVAEVAPALTFDISEAEYERICRFVTSIRWRLSETCDRISGAIKKRTKLLQTKGYHKQLNGNLHSRPTV